jgi:hypothetical protein
MTIRLNPDLEQEVQRLADRRGREVEVIVAEAVQRYIASESPHAVSTSGQDTGNGLPPELADIRTAIESSRGLLELEDEAADGGVAPVNERTWTRATHFLLRYAKWVWDTHRKVIDAPDLTPGPAGSLDLHWDRPDYELLVNIPVDEHAMAGFYGDDRGSVCIKGRFDPNHANEGLLQWLIRAG